MKYYLVEENGNESNLVVIGSTAEVPGGIPVSDSFSVTDHQFLTYDDVNEEVLLDTTAKATYEATLAVTSSITSLYETMFTEIYDKVYEVYGTRSDNVALAELETYKDMLSRPAAYALKNKIITGEVRTSGGALLFSVDDVLDTDTKVTDYATRKLEMVSELGEYRVDKLNQFHVDKKAILEG